MKLLKSRKGQGAVEYALMIAVVLGIVVAALAVMKPQLTGIFGKSNAEITAANVAAT